MPSHLATNACLWLIISGIQELQLLGLIAVVVMMTRSDRTATHVAWVTCVACVGVGLAWLLWSDESMRRVSAANSQSILLPIWVVFASKACEIRSRVYWQGELVAFCVGLWVLLGVVVLASCLIISK